MGLALRAEQAAQRFLGRGLADRAGDGDHLCAEPRARRASEIGQARQHLVHHEKRRVRRELVGLRFCDHGEAGARGQRRSDEIMPVMNVALDRKISFAGCDGATVDRQARDSVRQRAAARGAHGLDHRLRSPQLRRVHATLGASAAATAS